MSESKEHTAQDDVIDSKEQEKESTETTQDDKTEQQQPTWTPVWDDNAQAYYWWNTETNETTWINPDASAEEVAAAQAQAASTATAANSNPLDFLLDRIDNVVKKKLDGLDESTTTGSSIPADNNTAAAYYDSSNSYATSYDGYPAAADPSASNSADLYTSQAHFNARTGKFATQADVNRLNPEMLSIEARAKRQMQNYFDVDSYTEQRNAQIHNAESGRINKKRPLTRKEVEYFKRMKKEKKSKRAREWLMQ
ncbi:serine threonine protein kinase CMGC group [Mucor velutinosus]|uniref:Serine threonine protein kinase CMGC group n=1 Tax=Mucor velutinosus TaxID=708070 RepID=A0AAN7DPV4_9FUNG|nr:serine threonine protein kinase CMGC group [Mucor velutinosus]